MAEALTAERLRSLLRYDPETGRFHWIVKRGAWKSRLESRAGSTGRNGYEYVRVDGRLYLAHRLATLFMTGRWPAADVDHINGDQSDNRWANLREASRQENLWNSAPRSTKRVREKGVWRYEHGYRAAIYVGGKSRHLGVYGTAKEAHAAYAQEATKLRGKFARA